MLKIRLQRVGQKHEPTYRVVVCDSKRGPKSGDNIEILGSYDARDKNETKVNGERANYWISQGAQVSDTVHNLLINLGIIKGDKKNVLPKKAPIQKDNSEQGTENSEEKLAEAPATEEGAEAPAPSDVESSGEAKEETPEEAPAEDAAPAEETPKEEPKEEVKEEEKPAE
jgi:small subunit ribosomal protein S16